MNKAQKNVPKRKVKCTYCNKIGGESIMQRWHFEKCKLNIKKELQYD